MAYPEFVLTEEQRALRATVRRFIAEAVVPLEKELDSEATELSEERLAPLRRKAQEAGLWCLGAPAELGGGGLDLFSLCIVEEEAAQHRLGVYNPTLGAFGADPPIMLYDGTKAQVEKYAGWTVKTGRRTFVAATEANSGSDLVGGVRTLARRDGGNWAINGSKIFISGADKADYGILLARTDPEKGRKGFSCFILEKDTPGFRVVRLVPVIRPWYPTELVFENCTVPAANLLGEEGQGFELLQKWALHNRVVYAAGCVGTAVIAQRMSVEYAKERVTFGAPIAQRQAVQWMLVDSDLDISSARWLVWEAAWRADKGLPFMAEASKAKLYATEMAGRVVDRAIQVHGGIGLTKDLPLERWYRELRVKRIGEGPSEIHRMIIAREIIR